MTNMKALLVIAICIWCTLMVAPTWALTFDVSDSGTEDDYSNSVEALRGLLKVTTQKHGIPVMPKPSTIRDSQRYVVVDVKAAEDKTISLAIDIISLYVVAYRDTYQGKDRAHFFTDGDASKAKSYVFKGATSVDISFKSGYGDMERAAKLGRENIELGIYKLQYAILQIFGKKEIDQKNEAKCLIIAIQMVAEAARFKYIQNKVVQVGKYDSFPPDSKVLSLETSWQAISKAILKSGANKNITPALQLRDPNNKPWIVVNVNDIAGDMGLLKYEV